VFGISVELSPGQHEVFSQKRQWVDVTTDVPQNVSHINSKANLTCKLPLQG
jgi:hypothetical protein